MRNSVVKLRRHGSDQLTVAHLLQRDAGLISTHAHVVAEVISAAIAADPTSQAAKLLAGAEQSIAFIAALSHR